MSRAERRKEEKENKKKFTVGEVKDLMHASTAAARHEAVQMATERCVTLHLMTQFLVLHDKLGWGRKRIIEFYCQQVGVMEAIRTDHLSVDDIAQILQDEVFGEGDIFTKLEGARRARKENKQWQE